MEINKRLNFYEINFENKQIARLHMTRIKKEKGYTEKYVLEYKNKENENIGILLSIAVDMMNNKI